MCPLDLADFSFHVNAPGILDIDMPFVFLRVREGFLDGFERRFGSVLGPDADIPVPLLDREHPHLVGDPPGEPDVRVLVDPDRDNRWGRLAVDLGIEDVGNLRDHAVGMGKIRIRRESRRLPISSEKLTLVAASNARSLSRLFLLWK